MEKTKNTGRRNVLQYAAALSGILCRYGGNFGIWRLFTHIVQRFQLTPDAFASGLADAYTMGQPDIYSAPLLFQAARRRDMMTAEELAVFDALPPRLTIFRGCSIEEHTAGAYGLSWTLDRETAEFFAWRFDAADKTRCVVSASITPGDVLAYFNRRREQEIITAAPGPGVEVIAREPSPLYWARMNRRGR